jgi:hypothetical protein
MLLVAVWVLLILAGLAAMLLQQDAWPFSCYPMFSRHMYPETLMVYRVSLECSDGTRFWWRPHFYTLQQGLGSRLVRLSSSPDVLNHTTVQELVNVIVQEDVGLLPSGKQVRDLSVVLRRCEVTLTGDYIIRDQVVLDIELAE